MENRFAYRGSPGEPKYIGQPSFRIPSAEMIRRESNDPCMKRGFSLWPFQFGGFWLSSSSVLPAFAFSFLRSISRAAFFCFFSRRAVSFCRFLNVSVAINVLFSYGCGSQRYLGRASFFPVRGFMLFSHVQSLVYLLLGRAFCFSGHF